MATRSHTVNTRANFQRADTVTWVGNSCGRHGSYIFYKAFQFYPSKSPVSFNSGVLVRGRTRDRRNTLSDSDATKSAADRNGVPDENSSVESNCDKRILSLGEFFFVQCRPEDPVCIGELQLLWHDKHSGQDLSSTRLYYLPETTPAGRTTQHGQDEVLAVSEKVVMRINDLASWVVEPEEWHYGCGPPVFEESPVADFNQPVSTSMHRYSMLRPCVNISDVKLAKQSLMINSMCPEHKNYAEKFLKDKALQANDKIKLPEEQKPFSTGCKNCSIRRPKAQVLVLSLTSYCRHKAVMKRIEEANPDWLSQPRAKQLIVALGAYTTSNPMLRLVFCRDSFDYSQLFEHDLICEEFAPVFKGRPRKKNKRSHQSGGKGSSRKALGGEEARSAVENSCSDTKVETDEAAQSNRRRSKRKLPNRSSDEESFALNFALVRLNKRVRRGPYLQSTNNYQKASSRATSKSEPSSPTEGVSEEAEANGIRRSKRRPRPRPTDLSIALRNSLLENHKIKSKHTKQRPQRPPSSASSTSGSSRSSSPTEDSISHDKTPSPTGSATSASSLPCEIRNVQTSPTSPPDFTNILTSTPGDPPSASKDLDLSSESNMYLRGLSEGHLPENKSEFLELLNQFMRKQNTPIGRIPSLGFKKLDLWTFFKLSQEYGGYDMITAKRLWKHVYDRMGGNPSCTSAATCTRKHFEKLLLPLEKYLRLRQALPNKEADATKTKNEEVTAVIKSDNPAHLTTLNGRTFDGDVYFHNSATMASSSPKDECPPQKPSAPVTSSAPSSLTESLTSHASKFKSDAPVRCSTSSGVGLLSNGLNLETIVNNVVRSQFMNHPQARAGLASKPLKPDPGPGGVDLVDLTGGSGKYPSSSFQSSRPMSAHQSPQVTARPQTLYVFTRTHCPRRSFAPPPFVPKASTRTQPLPQALEKKDASYVELSRMDEGRSQKRPTPYSTSPSSPKRSRDSTVLPDSNFNRRSHVGSMGTLPVDIKSQLYNRDNLVAPPRTSVAQGVKTEPSDNEISSFASHTKPSHPCSSAVAFSRPSTTTVRRDYRAAIESHRSKHPTSTNEDPRAITSESYHRTPASDHLKHPSRRYPDPTEERKERSYYRPNGMLANHRERQLQAKAATPTSGVKNEKLNLDDRLSRPTISVHSDRSVSRSVPSHTSKENECIAASIQRPPKPTPPQPTKQDVPRPTFSSPFSVDRLTSASNNRTPLANGSSAPEVIPTKENRPQHPVSISNSSSTVLPRFMDPRQMNYKRTEKETFRPSSGHGYSTSRGDRSLPGDAYSVIKRPGPIASSSSEKHSMPQDIRTLLEALPHGAQPTPGVPPATLEHLLQAKLPFLQGTGPLPQSLLATPPLNQFSVLPESLDSSLLLRRQQEEQLSRNSMLNEISLIQMYQQLTYNQLAANGFLRQLPNTASLAASNAGLNRPLAAATKHPGRPDILSQLGTQIAMPQAPILVANPPPPQQSAPDVRVGLPFPFSGR